MKQQLCLKIRHRERETDRQRQRKREGVWQTDTDCYISSYDVKEYRRENPQKIDYKECAAKLQIKSRDFKVMEDFWEMRRLTTKEKNSKEGKKKKNMGAAAFFERIECSYLNKQKFILAIFS